MKTLISNIYKDIFGNEELSEAQNGNEQEQIEKITIKGIEDLYKIPKYLETYFILCFCMLTNSMIYMIFIAPLRIIKDIIKLILRKKVDMIRLKINIMNVLILIGGIILKDYSENMYLLDLFKLIMRGTKKWKLFSILKIIEFSISLLNKLTASYNIQIFTIFFIKKNKKKLFVLFLIAVEFYLYILISLCYMKTISIGLLDYSNIIYTIFFKMGYKEIKRYGKRISKTKIITQLNTDTYDRLFFYSYLFCVIFHDATKGKIPYENYIDYIYKIIFVLLIQICFDWVKYYIIFKLSNYQTKILKYLCYETSIYYEKLRHQVISKNTPTTNNTINKSKKYIDIINDTNLIIVGQKNYYHNYLPYFNYDQIICLTFNVNVGIFAIIISHIIIKCLKWNYLLYLYLLICCIFIRQLIFALISIFINKVTNKTNDIFNPSFRVEFASYSPKLDKDENPTDRTYPLYTLFAKVFLGIFDD